MIKIRSLLLLAILSYVGFLLVLFPVAQLGTHAEKVLSRWVSLNKIEGNLLSANASYQVRQIPTSVSNGSVNWAPSVFPLFRIQLGGKLNFKHNGLDVSLIAGKGLDTFTISRISGSLHSRFINQFLNDTGTQVSGEFSLNNLVVTQSLTDGHYTEAGGTISYPGGRAVIPQAGGSSKRKSINVPAIVATLSNTDKGGISLDVLTQESGKLIANVDLTPDGWGQIRVYKSFLKLTGLSKVSGKETDAFLNIKQRIF